jgi:predicted house-cleaning noncanonical NTP pyrophosphatase (MazG superfamily)
MKYDKLVRDNIPEIIKNKRQVPRIRIADQKEFKEKLLQKLREEVNEFIADENPEELADILEVIYALAGVLSLTPEELEVMRKKKAGERGAFKEKIILDEVVDP